MEGERVTVIIIRLEVHIHNTTGPNIVHLLPKQRLDLRELPRLDLITSILGEEHRDGVIPKLFRPLIKPGLGITRLPAPGVDVISPEVDTLVLTPTVKVIRHIVPNVGVIVSRIPNTNGPVSLALDVGFRIPDGGFDEGAGIRGSDVIRDFVAGEKAQCVVVLDELVYDVRVARVQAGFPGRVGAVDGLGWV